MSPSAALDERVFSEIKRLCFSGLDDLTLLREVATRLQRAVPFEAYCASTVDPLSGLITRSTAEGMYAKIQQIYWERRSEMPQAQVTMDVRTRGRDAACATKA